MQQQSACMVTYRRQTFKNDGDLFQRQEHHMLQMLRIILRKQNQHEIKEYFIQPV